MGILKRFGVKPILEKYSRPNRGAYKLPIIKFPPRNVPVGA